MTESDETNCKRDRTRAMILDHALRLFQEQGFEKTTMRAIAAECDLSLGAAYYHFPSKESLVLAFYQRGAEEAKARNAATVAGTTDFQERIADLLRYRLQQLTPYRNLVGVLARQAADMASPLSPFSAETRALREDAIALFAEAMNDTNLKVGKSLRPHLPKLLWLMQLGIVLYWANDRSPTQSRSEELITHSLQLLMPLLRATSLPLMGPVVKASLRVIHVAESCLSPPAPSA